MFFRGMRWAIARVLTIAVAIAVIGLPWTASAHPPKPMGLTQPLRDGCQRSDLGIGVDSSPEWVYIYRDPTLRMATGIVRVSHASLEDAILEHRSYDYNGNLVADPPFQYLIAGSKAKGTNNYTRGGGEEYGRLHFEWESATLPFFAWPTDGDRATLWGSWIWDCGHWQGSSENNTGTITTGEHSELHPLHAIAVNRSTPYLSRKGESETDVFASNMGDGAHAVEHCAMTHRKPGNQVPPQYDPGFPPCAKDKSNRVQPLAGRYTFFVPAPPKPSRGAKLRLRIVNRIAGGSGSERVRKLANGIAVTVTLKGANHVVGYGKSFFVSWSVPPRRAPVALDVTLKSILIRHADPNPALKDPSGANWNLYLDLNGYWQLLNKWIPRLTTHVVDNERIAINRTVRIYVPRRAGVSLLIQGRECDEPAGKLLFGIFANLLYPCPANTDEQNPNPLLLFVNDDTGTILDVYRSPGSSLGTHTSTAVATTNKFRGSGPITFGNGIQGKNGYTLTYTVTRG